MVKRLELGKVEDSAWGPLVVTATMLLFRLALKSEKVQKPLREGRELQDVLNRQGCLACGHFRAYTFVAKFIRTYGLEHASMVAAGEVDDPEFTEWE